MLQVVAWYLMEMCYVSRFRIIAEFDYIWEFKSTCSKVMICLYSKRSLCHLIKFLKVIFLILFVIV